MNKAYVSEFTTFIGQYLQEHPEEVAEQRRGWRIFWHRHVDFAAQQEALVDAVPDDNYGFQWSAGTPPPHH